MMAGGFERYAHQFMKGDLSPQDKLKLATGENANPSQSM